jgi:6-pyruvoyl-tetrahydropterin synthase
MGGRWDADSVDDFDRFHTGPDGTDDHRYLNDDMGNLSPSAQNLAVWVFEQWMARLPNSQLSGSRDADDLARRTRRQLS